MSHVFIIRGDLTRLACDAWLLPTDRNLHVTEGWLQDAPADIKALAADDFRKLKQPGGNGTRRVVRLGPWCAADPRRVRAARCVSWLVDVGAWAGKEMQWYAEGVKAFFEEASPEAKESARARQREKALLALPLVGTGRGGAARAKGEMVKTLLPLLRESARHHDVDVALVTDSAAAFAAAQWARRQLNEPATSELNSGLMGEVKRLGGYVRGGRLVLFLGAGVSSGAGLPLWSELMDQLAEDAELTERTRFRKLPLIDQARILASRFEGDRVSLGSRVANLLEARHYSLTHGIVASLPVAEMVTTNYDTLLEMAADAAKWKVAVVPHETTPEGGRWLIKLHGSITRPDEIVLTREDYLRYQQRWAALAGIVQALLVTRHMLFVGFSLEDDNFQRIVDGVRRLLAGAGNRQNPDGEFGTAVMLQEDALLRELWRGELRSVAMSTEDDFAARRRLEIFLDLLLAEASDGAAHLLDPDYSFTLSDEDRALSEALRELMDRTELRGSTGWPHLHRALKALGAPDSRTDDR